MFLAGGVGLGDGVEVLAVPSLGGVEPASPRK
jgi:hypothetical protein